MTGSAAACPSSVYISRQQAEPACAVTNSSVSGYQEYLWREPVYVRGCTVFEEIHRLLSGTRSCAEVRIRVRCQEHWLLTFGSV
jgi:hypothetical protein